MPDADRTIQLDQLRIASPCPARWEDMTGDDRVRHCAQCNLDVYNAAALTRDEIFDLVKHKIDTNTRLCAQLRYRGDGTLITADCPVGLAYVRRRARIAAARVAAVLGLSALAMWLTPAQPLAAAGQKAASWPVLRESYDALRSGLIRAGLINRPTQQWTGQAVVRNGSIGGSVCVRGDVALPRQTPTIPSPATQPTPTTTLGRVAPPQHTPE